ncbi:DUF799 family lipoprotein, partial [bacterium]|nr:DUF799 family lipoprotein [bacterium]
MNRTTSNFLLIAIAALVLMGCAPTKESKLNLFPEMYTEHPQTVLVLPPMNESTSPEAKEYFQCTLLQPVAEMGYYVIPIEVVCEILKSEGAYDSELLDESALTKFAEYFGADAVLWTKVKKWDKSFKVLAGHVVVSIEYSLQSTKTNEVLWSYDWTLKIDNSGDDGGAGGLVGLPGQTGFPTLKKKTTGHMP